MAQGQRERVCRGCGKSVWLRRVEDVPFECENCVRMRYYEVWRRDLALPPNRETSSLLAQMCEILGVLLISLCLSTPLFAESGIASWYSATDAGVGETTANGEKFDDTAYTCASWKYPFETILEVTNPKNGKSVRCRVNDRGPARWLGRAIDLTPRGFKQIADPSDGLAEVEIKPVGRKK